MEYWGIELHAEYSQICILDEDGEVVETSRVGTSHKALERFFRREPMRVVLEAGGSSPWVSRLLESLSHDVVVCSPRRVRLIAESKLKNDRVDAEVLARLTGEIDRRNEHLEEMVKDLPEVDHLRQIPGVRQRNRRPCQKGSN